MRSWTGFSNLSSNWLLIFSTPHTVVRQESSSSRTRRASPHPARMLTSRNGAISIVTNFPTKLHNYSNDKMILKLKYVDSRI